MAKKKKKKKSPKRRIGCLWIFGKVFSLCFLAAFLAGGFILVKRVAIPVVSMSQEAKKMVDESTPDTFKSGQPSIIYDVEGKELKKMKGEKDSKYMTFDELPDAAKLAIISVEDKKFTFHKGIDLQGIARAMLALIRNGGEISGGGSTITQQLSRNIFLNFDVNYTRKIKEMFIAIALEEKYTKSEILEFYLNNVYFANGYYGIESASQAYFHKSSTELTIAQVAFLCAIPNSPTLYDPYQHADSTMKRRNKILKNMYRDGYIDGAQYEKSMTENIEIYPKREITTNDYAQTFILKCAVESLMKAQGFEFRTKFDSDDDKEQYDQDYDEMYNVCRQSLYNNGYQVYTSIDTKKQEEMQTAIAKELGGTFIGKTDDGIYEVQGAAVCIENQTGRVTAIVGGREEGQEGYGLNRAYQSFRQPGSSIKPILVYAPAMENGYTPDSTLDDHKMEGKDKVSNAGDSYEGLVSLRRAVEKSSNVATLRLYQDLGTDKCMKYLEELNFRGLKEDDYLYPTTCLGGFTEGTSPLEMAAAFATLYNDGIYRTPTCIVKIIDADGNEIVKDKAETKEIYTKQAARMMTNVLKSCVTSYGGTAHVCQMDSGIPAACKTGTTTNCVDGWLCGYTPYYTTAVWVGRDIFKEVENLKGNTYPASIWKAFMDAIHEGITRDYTLEDDFGRYDDLGINPKDLIGDKEEPTEEEVTTENRPTTESTTEDPYGYLPDETEDPYETDDPYDQYNQYQPGNNQPGGNQPGGNYNNNNNDSYNPGSDNEREPINQDDSYNDDSNQYNQYNDYGGGDDEGISGEILEF